MKFRRIIKAFRFNRIFWASCTLIIVANLVFYFVVVGGQKAETERLQALYSKKRNPDVPGARDEIAKYWIAGVELKLFKSGLAPKEKFVERIREIHGLLRRHGLWMNRITFRPEQEGPLNLWKYTSSFTVRGKYAQLKRFIADLQNSPNAFCLEHISFKALPRSRRLVDMNLEVSTYFK